MAKFVQRRAQAASGAVAEQPAQGGEWEKKFPALLEHLTLTEWEPGVPRKTSSLSIFTDEGVWKCCLSDRDTKRVAFFSVKTPEALLPQLERALQADTLDWRAMRPAQGGKGK